MIKDKQIKSLIKTLHSKGYDTGKNLDFAVEWLFDVENKNLVFNEFSKVSNPQLSTFSLGKLKEYANHLFDYPHYMGMPKFLSNDLNGDEVDLIQELVIEQLIDCYAEELLSISSQNNVKKTKKLKI